MPLFAVYPNSPAHILTAWPIANPAAGAELVCTVPQGKVWVVNSITFSLITSAVAAQRRVNLIIDDGGTGYLYDDGANIQFGSESVFYSWYESGAVSRTTPALPAGSVWSPGNRFPVIFPQRFVLRGGFRIRTLTNNLQVADQFKVSGATSGLFCVEEYRES